MADTSRGTIQITRQIMRIGEFAARFLAAHATANIAAVFERSLYLESGGAFVCLGDASIGDGPLNAIMDGSAATWIATSTPGDTVDIHDGCLHAHTWRASFAHTQCWQPPPWPCPASAERVAEALHRIAAISTSTMPPDGLAPLVLRAAPTHDLATTFARVALPRLSEFEAWLVSSPLVGDVARSTGRKAALLLGLGPGLTPSGDDALCGVLLALDALGAHDTRAALATEVRAAAPSATTPLSAAFLAAAAEGQGSAALLDFIAALVAAELDALPATIAALGRVGHTSGWDALAGAYLTLSAFVRAAPPTRSP